MKKLRGKRRECSLRTTDRKIAERRLREWMRDLEIVDCKVEKTTVRELLRKFVVANQGKSVKTRRTNASIIRHMELSWLGGVDVEVRSVRPSHLDEWLARHEKRLKNTSYNRYAGLLKQLFDIAVRDHIVAQSPFDRVHTRWKKPQDPVRLVPTDEQFRAIVEEIRSQRYTRFAAATADFLEFLGVAGAGTG